MKKKDGIIKNHSERVLHNNELESLDDLFSEVESASYYTEKVRKDYRNPFKFLDPYEKEDADLFFGRDIEIAELYHHFFLSQLCVVYGESGTGKTSLIQCGLQSRMPAEDALFITVRSARDPIAVLCSELKKELGLEKKTDLEDRWPSDSCKDKCDLTSDVSSTGFTGANGVECRSLELLRETIYRKGKTVSIVFDQFEEFFLFQPRVVRDRFAKELSKWLKSELDLRILICIREEYLARLTELEEDIPALYENRVWVRRMSGDLAREVIVKSCFTCSVTIEDALVEELINELTRGGIGVDLPLMQVVLDTLYRSCIELDYPSKETDIEHARKCKNRDDIATPAITLLLYKKLGRVQTILSKFIEDRVNHHDNPDSVRGVLKALVTPEGTKRISTRDEIMENAAHFGAELSAILLDELIAKLVNDRVLREEAESHLLELRHDRLAQAVHAWMTGLEQELAEVRSALVNRHKEYQARGKCIKALLDDQFLDYLSGYHSRLRLSGDLLKFVNDSRIALANRTRRIRRRNTFTLLSVATILLVVLFSLFLWNAWKNARHSAEEARLRTKEAEKAQGVARKETQKAMRLGLIAESRRLSSQKQKVEALALIRAVRTLPRSENEDDREMLKEIFSLTNNPLPLILTEHEDEVVSLDFSINHNLIATASADKTARIWDYSSGHLIHSLKGHKDTLLSIVFSPDGRFLATSSKDKTAMIWYVESGRRIRTLKAHRGEIGSLEFSPNGELLATVSKDKTAKIWHVGTGTMVHSLDGHDGGVNCLAFSPNGVHIATGSDDNTARIWEIESGKLLHSLARHRGIVNDVAFSTYGQRIATASRDNTAKIWHVGSGRLVRTLRGHTAAVVSAKFSSFGEAGLIATASEDNTVRIWHANSGKLVNELKGHKGAINSIAFSSDGQLLATGSNDYTAHVWDVNTGRSIYKLKGHKDYVRKVSFSPKYSILATASSDKTTRLWHLATIGSLGSGRCIAALDKPNRGNASFALSSDGQYIATSSGNVADLSTRIWSIHSQSQVHSFSGHFWRINSVAFSPDDNRIVTSSDDKTAKIWDVESRGEISTLYGHEEEVYIAKFSPKKQIVATGSADTTIRLWDPITGSNLKTLNEPTSGVRVLDFSPDGRYIAAPTGKAAIIWNVESGEVLHTLISHKAAISNIAFSKDSNRIATTSYDRSVHIWDIASGQRIHTLGGHKGPVLHAVFSRDNRHLATASTDKVARIWNVATGQLIRELVGHKAPIQYVAFSPDGRRIATASADFTAYIWDVSTGRMIHSLPEHNGKVLALSFSPDGNLVVTMSENDNFRVWEVVVEPYIEKMLSISGKRTNLRVCRKSLLVTPVLPFPPGNDVWAPESLCKALEAGLDKEKEFRIEEHHFIKKKSKRFKQKKRKPKKFEQRVQVEEDEKQNIKKKKTHQPTPNRMLTVPGDPLDGL